MKNQVNHVRTGNGGAIYVSDKGQVGYRDMSGKPIPFSINPGPTMTCGKCGFHGMGVEMLWDGCARCTGGSR